MERAQAIADRHLGHAAIWLIALYRRFLSPVKGFSCPHQRLHQSGSCSDYGVEAFRGHGFSGGKRLLKARLHACRAARLKLAAATHGGGGTGDDAGAGEKRNDRKKRSWLNHCDCGGGGLGGGKSSAGADGADCGGFDCSFS